MQRVPDGAFCLRVPDGFGNLLVCPGFAVGDVPDSLEYLDLELRARNLDGHAEFLQFACEVEIQFAHYGPVGLLGGSLQCGILLGCGVCACLDRARNNCGVLCPCKMEPAQELPFEREGPLAPHVAVTDCLNVPCWFGHALNIRIYLLSFIMVQAQLRRKMKKERVIPGIYLFGMVFVASVLLLAGCGDDESFSPVAKNRGYDYAYTTAKDLSKTPCNEMRENREAVIGRDKDRYECRFDYRDSVYLWVGYDDTLTAEGREYHRVESSSSEDDEDSSSSRSSSSSSSRSSSSSFSSSSSSYSSSAGSSSSYVSTGSSYDGYGKVKIAFTLDSKEDLFNPNIDYGTMTDGRDGQVYRTVVIGNRVWMAENLNFAGDSDYPIVKKESVCLNYDDANCKLLGRLYSRAAAMNDMSCDVGSTCNLGQGLVQGVCPDGWHIPSEDDVDNFIDAFDGNAVGTRSAMGWNDTIQTGTDSLGFSMPGSGILNLDDRAFKHAGSIGYLWYYTPYYEQKYMIFTPDLADTTVRLHSGYSYKVFISVRCVKGEAAPVSSSSSSYSSSSVSSSSVSSSSVSSSSRELSTPLTVKGEQFNPDIDYGTMTDPRDGKTYKTVVVEGKTWMAENLNFVGNEDFPLAEQYSLCPYDEEENCELYGRLYTREAAMNSDTCAYNTYCSLADPLQGVCPAGWHIPSLTEATDLKNLASDSFLTLTSAKGWGNDTLSVYSGDDTYGLSFLPAGDKSGDDYKYFGANAFMWANIPGDEQRYFVINASEKKAFIHSGYSVNVLYLSVRCVKD